MSDEEPQTSHKRKRKKTRFGPRPPAGSPAAAFPKGTPINPATQLPPGEEVMISVDEARAVGLDQESARTLAEHKETIARKAKGELNVRWNADDRVKYQQAVTIFPNAKVSFEQMSPVRHQNINSRLIADLRDYDDVIKYLRDNCWRGGSESYKWRVGDYANPQYATGKIEFPADPERNGVESMAKKDQQAPPGWPVAPYGHLGAQAPGYGPPSGYGPPPGYGYGPAPGYAPPPYYPPPQYYAAPPPPPQPQAAPPAPAPAPASPQPMQPTVVMQPMPMPMPMPTPQGPPQPVGPDPRDAFINQLLAQQNDLLSRLQQQMQQQQQQVQQQPQQQQQVPYDPYWWYRFYQPQQQQQQQQQPQQPPQPPPQRPIETVREAVSTVVELKRQIRNLSDEDEDDRQEPPPQETNPDNFPIQTKTVGGVEMVAIDGKIDKGAPFVFANLPTLFGMVKEGWKELKGTLAEREQAQTRFVDQDRNARRAKLEEQRAAVENAERLAAAQEQMARAQTLMHGLQAVSPPQQPQQEWQSPPQPQPAPRQEWQPQPQPPAPQQEWQPPQPPQPQSFQPSSPPQQQEWQSPPEPVPQQPQKVEAVERVPQEPLAESEWPLLIQSPESEETPEEAPEESPSVPAAESN